MSKWRTGAGVAVLLLSSVGFLAWYVVAPAHISGGTAAEQVAALVGHGSAAQAALWLDLLLLLVIPASLYIGEVAGARTSRTATVGTALVFTTSLGAGYLLGADVLVYLASTVPDRAGATQLVSAYESYAVVVFVIATSVLGGLIGFVLLAVALVRARSMPVWAGVSVGASAVLEVAGQAAQVNAVVVLAYALRVAAFAACALALVQLRSAVTGEARTDVGAAV